MFSIVIPTFNNLEYLKLLISSIKKNSKFKHEIILHINEGTDGSFDYAKRNNIKHTYSEKNVGLCTATNLAASKSSSEYILYSHDDMYFCPDWDVHLKDELNKLKDNYFYLSATMIEKNSGHIQFDSGNNFKDFNEEKLLNNFHLLNYKDYQGSHWAPHLIHKKLWKKIGGFSEEFNPGIGSDPDLNMKLWKEGVRVFKGISNFKVYHFGSISLRKKSDLKVNKGAKTFLKKWKITPSFFVKHYLRGGKFENNRIISNTYDGPLQDPSKNLNYWAELLICKIKLLSYF